MRKTVESLESPLITKLRANIERCKANLELLRLKELRIQADADEKVARIDRQILRLRQARASKRAKNKRKKADALKQSQSQAIRASEPSPRTRRKKRELECSPAPIEN